MSFFVSTNYYLIGKQVCSIYEGEVVGTVLSVVFNEHYTKIKSLLIFNNEEEEFEINIKSTLSVGDCVVIKNISLLKPPYSQANLSRVFLNVYDLNAKHLGKIVDISFNEAGVVENFITSNDVFLRPENTYLRKDFIIHTEQKLSIKNMKPKLNKMDLSKIKVNILNISDAKDMSYFVPNKLQYNPNSILGKISKDDLVGLNKEIIIHKNQVITEKIIQDATRHNRLNQLYYLAN